MTQTRRVSTSNRITSYNVCYTKLLRALLSLVLLFGRWERPLLIVLFALYLSLYHAGQVFTNFLV